MSGEKVGGYISVIALDEQGNGCRTNVGAAWETFEEAQADFDQRRAQEDEKGLYILDLYERDDDGEDSLIESITVTGETLEAILGHPAPTYEEARAAEMQKLKERFGDRFVP